MSDPIDLVSTNPETPETPKLQTEPKSRATGPRTPLGKRRSSQNAIKHGLAGRIVVIPGESVAEYLAHLEAMEEEWHPCTTTEQQLTHAIADGWWKLKRHREVEDCIISGHRYRPGLDKFLDNVNNLTPRDAHAIAGELMQNHSGEFNTLSLYESRIRRSIEKNTKLLRDHQQHRLQNEANAIDEAIKIYQFNKMMTEGGRPEEGVIELSPIDDFLADQQLPREGNRPAQTPDAKGDIHVRQFVCSSEGIERLIKRKAGLQRLEAAEKAAFNYKEFLQNAA